MTLSPLKKIMARFREDNSGVIVVEMVITLPLLILALAFTYEFFEIFRYQSIRDKATYVVADMISREAVVPGFVDDTYMNNSLTLFNDIVTDNGVNQIRVTMVKFENSNGYTVPWSQVRGSGSMQQMVDADIQGDLAHIPNLADGEWVILVDATSAYTPFFNVGFGNNIPMASRTFTSFREIPKICYGPNPC